MVFPPKATSKNAVPNIRSNINKNKLIVNAGNANKINILVINVDHENKGIRIYVIPGARIVRMVAMKLIRPISVPAPAICSHLIKKSTPCPGDCIAKEAYDVQPASGAPHNRKLKFNNNPPKKNNQKLNALR